MTAKIGLTLALRATGNPGKHGGESFDVFLESTRLGSISANAPEVDPWQWEGLPSFGGLIEDAITPGINRLVKELRREHPPTL